MTHRIGPNQKAVLRAIRDGAELWWQFPQWRLNGVIVNRDRCSALHLRGFLMGTTVEMLPGEDRRQRFELTDKGKAAL